MQFNQSNNAGRTRSRNALLVLSLALLPFLGISQATVNPRTVPVGEGAVKDFLDARCACSATDTARIAAFPALYRNRFVNAIYGPGEQVPFQVYFAERQGGQLYLVSKGVCRNISTSIKIPEPGYYFVRFFHPENPALLEVDARRQTLYVRAFGKCELGKTSKPKSN